jgi:hypothetical protein
MRSSIAFLSISAATICTRCLDTSSFSAVTMRFNSVWISAAAFATRLILL